MSVEADRKAFLIKHFHVDFADAATFDVVVNTAVLGVGGACDAVKTALTRIPARAGLTSAITG